MATYLAKWGNKGFLINPGKIVPLLNLATSFSRKADENEDTSGTPPTNTRGIELQTITLETTYLAAAGVDPRGQIEDWKAQFGKQYPLYINGKRFGPKLLELESVNFSGIELDNAGRFLKVEAAVTLKEYVPPTTTVSSKKNATTTTGSTASAASTGSSNLQAVQSNISQLAAAAMSAKPTTEEKRAKMRSTTVLESGRLTT